MKINKLYLIIVLQGMLIVTLLSLLLFPPNRKQEPCEPYASVIESSTKFINIYFKCDINKVKIFFKPIEKRVTCTNKKLYGSAFALANTIAVDSFINIHVTEELTKKYNCNYEIVRKWKEKGMSSRKLIYGFQQTLR